AGQAISGLVRVGQTKRAVNKRLAVVEGSGLALGDLVIELRKQRGLNENGESILSWAWLADLVIRSGVTFQPRRWAVMVGGLALVVMLAVLVLTKAVYFALPAGF